MFDSNTEKDEVANTSEQLLETETTKKDGIKII